ncbi:MAG: ATP phosphoribosyltransferase regulatory subunit [Dehalococcoidales bacterium]|nr:ATP phosphoribosyltransferase regulatory subunit [Dehalococcoidales bacterium]
MRVQKCKGTRDLTPRQMGQFRFVESVFRDACLKWGYEEVRTPTLEYLHLFTSTGTLTPGTLGKVYSFLDWDGWSGERVVLRPDGTIPVARMYIDTGKTEPARYFYVTNIFIFEPTGKENRERWQCGTEMIGVSSPSADVELISVALETLRNIGLKDLKVKLSHAGIIRALLAGFGLSPEEQGKAFDRILDGDAAVISQLTQQKPEMVKLLAPLLDMKGANAGFLKNQKAVLTNQLPDFVAAMDNFIQICELLTAVGIQYEIDIASGTGFEYYTGLIFQVFTKDIKVGGGGRYDALIPLLGGENTPASGFAIYADPIMNLISQYAADEAAPVNVYVKNCSIATNHRAFAVLNDLHNVGLKASLALDDIPSVNGWRIEISDSVPYYTVQSADGKKSAKVTSVEEVLKLLGGKS